MPQIWMTYAEAGELLGLSPMAMRDHCLVAGLSRRRSRDGQTRLKLSSEAIALFIQREVRRHLEANLPSLGVHDLQQLASLPLAPERRAA